MTFCNTLFKHKLYIEQTNSPHKVTAWPREKEEWDPSGELWWELCSLTSRLFGPLASKAGAPDKMALVVQLVDLGLLDQPICPWCACSSHQ